MIVAAAHLTPGMSFMDTPSDEPYINDGGMHGLVRVRQTPSRFEPYIQVYVEDESGIEWFRRYFPTRLLDIV